MCRLRVVLHKFTSVGSKLTASVFACLYCAIDFKIKKGNRINAFDSAVAYFSVHGVLRRTGVFDVFGWWVVPFAYKQFVVCMMQNCVQWFQTFSSS
jgi:hypothetical protein